ncbi:MAG: hypothetical protein DMF63_09685 [Acidobacteria bacterium]|nr:MAG: hypothetical protein DMF63_09685 [Acidobacteriota bacterium]
MRKNYKAVLFFAIVAAFAGSVSAQHNAVDPTFNLQVESSVYSRKWVNAIQVLPDGKLVALGAFNTYNRVPVGKVVRLNADGSLDTTFNNQTVTAANEMEQGSILVQPDGKLVLRNGGLVAGNQGPKSLLRLNPDGTLDSTFNYTLATAFRVIMDSTGRLIVQGTFTTPQGPRSAIRLNDDGSLDSSFNLTPTPAGYVLDNVVTQGTKLIVSTSQGNNRRIYRVNEDGSEDVSFTARTGTSTLGLVAVQPDNKIFYRVSSDLFRMNENGNGDDSTFQSINLSQAGFVDTMKLTGDGKLVFTIQGSPATFRRFLSTGAVDPSFTPYVTTAYACYTIQADGGIVMGDGIPFQPTSANNFVRLTPGGTPDPTFNQGGTGFQNVQPGIIQALATYPDGKVLIAGKFDVINGAPRHRIARLNADSTIDSGFQVNTTSGSGNYFVIIRDVYQIGLQADGKMVLSGWFDYFLNGVSKKNVVRLNADGSIDATFDLTHEIPDFSQILNGGQNRFGTYSDGKLMFGTSRNSTAIPVGPIKLTAGGARDTSFTSIFQNQSTVYYEDVAIQPDGKILAIGFYTTPSNVSKSFVIRFNTDGIVDSTFTPTEESPITKGHLALLPNGKILVIKYGFTGGTARVLRLNSDGSPDNTFTTVSTFDAAAKLNALLVLPDGKIFVGGKFTITVNGQQAKNLLQLDDDGSFESTIYNLNDEVFCLARDSEGRVLVGGGFTVIGANGSGATRAFVARLTSPAEFDYDGDGRADVSVFRPSENKWYVLRSSDSGLIQQTFAVAGDIPAPADYDGDGRTDMAIFRPSSGDWWYLSSINNAQINVRWGQSGDIPRPSDFDGDGKTDFVVYRPSNSAWYRSGSTGATSITQFGIADDKPLIGDFDGDGKSDLCVFRPSTGDWWYAASASGGQFNQVHWGQTGDIPVPADYDGDGKTDVAVYRASEGGWYIYNSRTGSSTTVAYGAIGDRPVAADYDGDGRADIAVFRPSTGIWYMLRSTAASAAAQWGVATDTPTEGAFIP